MNIRREEVAAAIREVPAVVCTDDGWFSWTSKYMAIVQYLLQKELNELQQPRNMN